MSTDHPRPAARACDEPAAPVVGPPRPGGYWRVHAAIAPLLGDARIAAPLTSQLLAGHVVVIDACAGAWCRVRGADGYMGWTHSGYLVPAAGDEASWRITTGARVRGADGREHELPFGARIAPDTHVLSGEVLTPAQCAAQHPPAAAPIAASARRWFTGASYCWGGVTPWGTDCSGFVQAILRLHGVALPRDAWQQALVGEPVARADAREADLHFFSDRGDGRVTHVALALDAETIVHSALARGGVAIERWERDDAVVARLRLEWVGARRVVRD
jgi:cell wall-associated NlpC family hydrolase